MSCLLFMLNDNNQLSLGRSSILFEDPCKAECDMLVQGSPGVPGGLQGSLGPTVGFGIKQKPSPTPKPPPSPASDHPNQNQMPACLGLAM